jgi:hypothetical protein
MMADLAPTLAHALAPASPSDAGVSSAKGLRSVEYARYPNCRRTPAFDAYVRDVVKLFRIWHCDKQVREAVFKVILHHRNVSFCIGISAGDPIAITAAFGLTAYEMCIGLFLGGKLEQRDMLTAHKCAVLFDGDPTAVQHIVAHLPQLGLDICNITPYSGYWTLLQNAPKRMRDGKIISSAKRPLLITNLEEAHGVANTWIGENKDPVYPISFLHALDMLRGGTPLPWKLPSVADGACAVGRDRSGLAFSF